MKKGIYIAVIVLLAITLVVSGIYLFNYFWEGKKEADRYQQLANIVQESRQETETTAATDPSASSEPTETAEFIPDPDNLDPEEGFPAIPDYKQLKQMNSDFVGWISIEGTKLNYPVMQTSVDNANYYLYRNFDKENSTRGSVYVREQCDVYKPSDNVTLYGHTMKDGSMFACLHDYVDKKAWDNNPLIFFDTTEEYHVYKIFSVFKTSANLGEGFSYHKFENAANQQEFDNFVATCKKLAFYDTGITPVYGDKLICLSTCEYSLDNGRLVVAAVRII